MARRRPNQGHLPSSWRVASHSDTTLRVRCPHYDKCFYYSARRHAARADILIAAIGKAKFVTADMVKPGAAVVDVGINRTDEGLVGEPDDDARCAEATGGVETGSQGGRLPVGPRRVVAHDHRGCVPGGIARLDEVLEGNLDQVIQPLINEYQADQLAALND